MRNTGCWGLVTGCELQVEEPVFERGRLVGRDEHRILNGKNGMDRIIGKDKEFFSSPSEFPNRVNVFLCELCLPRSSGRWYWDAFAGGPAARGLFGSV